MLDYVKEYNNLILKKRNSYCRIELVRRIKDYKWKAEMCVKLYNKDPIGMKHKLEHKEHWLGAYQGALEYTHSCRIINSSEYRKLQDWVFKWNIKVNLDF